MEIKGIFNLFLHTDPKSDDVSMPMVERSNVLVLSTWSSGSEVLAKFIHTYPNTFFSFEPFSLLPENITDTEKNELLLTIFQCHVHEGSHKGRSLEYIDKLLTDEYIVSHTNKHAVR